MATKTYRFKFNDEITDIVNRFSKLHANEERNYYNHYWQLWLLENDDLIRREESRLIEAGYKGDINEKLYKSARYYHRKKTDKTDKTDKTCSEKLKRRNYVSVSSDFIEAIDSHIKNFVKPQELSPASGYDDFCKKNNILLSTEVITLQEENDFDKDYIFSKIKKTYKNRYFYLLKLNN